MNDADTVARPARPGDPAARRARPDDQRPARLPASEVRRRAGVGALPARASAASTCRASSRTSSTPSSRRPAHRTTNRGGSPSASAWRHRRSWRSAREEQQALLRPLWTGEEVWCQLFSEPGAGSDLAAVATRAVPDGDTWVVNGQKVWTSVAHKADRAILVARTDPALPKHAGLTYFLLDMHDPGVEVRPLRQITGEAEFNEVFLTDVRIPDAMRVGEVGAGLAGRERDPDERAGGHRWRRGPARVRHDRQGRRDLARAPGAPYAGDARAADAAVGRGRGRPDHQHPAPPEAGGRRARPRGIGDEADLRPPRPGAVRASRSSCSATTGLRYQDWTMTRPEVVDFTGRDAGLPLPPGPRELHRGRHLRDPAQHHRRARARAAQRAEGRQGRRLEGPAAMTTTGTRTGELWLLADDVEEDLRASVRAVLEKHCPPERVTACYDGDDDVAAPAWSALARDLGLAALLVPDELGGAGASAREARSSRRRSAGPRHRSRSSPARWPPPRRSWPSAGTPRATCSGGSRQGDETAALLLPATARSVTGHALDVRRSRPLGHAFATSSASAAVSRPTSSSSRSAPTTGITLHAVPASDPGGHDHGPWCRST